MRVLSSLKTKRDIVMVKKGEMLHIHRGTNALGEKWLWDLSDQVLPARSKEVPLECEEQAKLGRCWN